MTVLRWPASDAERLEALRAGEAGAWSAFYDRYGTLVNQTVRHQLGTDPEIEDVVQDVLAKIVARIGEVRDPAALSGWIRSVALNTVRSELRRRYVRRILRFDHSAADQLKISGEDHEARSTLRSVYEILEELRPELRMAFVLRYVDECSLSEVGEACGWSLATTKRKLAKAHRRFQCVAKRRPDLRARLERGGRWT